MYVCGRLVCSLTGLNHRRYGRYDDQTYRIVNHKYGADCRYPRVPIYIHLEEMFDTPSDGVDRASQTKKRYSLALSFK